MAYKPQTTNVPASPARTGAITSVLSASRIGIDNGLITVTDARLAMAEKMNFQIGEIVEYRMLSQGPDKGRINYIGRPKEGNQQIPQQQKSPAPAVPANVPPPEKEEKISPVGQITARSAQTITFRYRNGMQDVFALDFEIAKMLSKPDAPVKTGDLCVLNLVKVSDRWVVTNIGPAVADEGFKTATEVKQEQPVQERKSDELLTDQEIADMKARADAAIKAKETQQQEKAMPSTPPTTKEEKVSQNANTAIPEEQQIAGSVSLKVHINMGSFCNFDLGVEGVNGEHARALLIQESGKTVSLVTEIMKQAMKASQQVRY